MDARRGSWFVLAVADEPRREERPHLDDQRKPAQAEWLGPALRDALERGPRGGLHLRLDIAGMTDTATGEPSIVLNGRPMRPYQSSRSSAQSTSRRTRFRKCSRRRYRPVRHALLVPDAQRIAYSSAPADSTGMVADVWSISPPGVGRRGLAAVTDREYDPDWCGVTFVFTSSEPSDTIECRLDGGKWSSCHTPKVQGMSTKTYRGLSNGSQLREARGTDAAGNVDLTPAQKTVIVRPRPCHRTPTGRHAQQQRRMSE